MAKKRERRQFDAMFKIETVRRMQEQLVLRVPLAQIVRDFGVRPDQLRTRARR